MMELSENEFAAQAKALEQLLKDIEDEGIKYQWRKWGYYGPGGWSGQQLRILVRFLKEHSEI